MQPAEGASILPGFHLIIFFLNKNSYFKVVMSRYAGKSPDINLGNIIWVDLYFLSHLD